MAKPKGLDSVTVLNVQPRYLVVPVALQLTAFQMIAPNLAPAKPADLVPDYIRALTPIAEPRLDAASTTASGEEGKFQVAGVFDLVRETGASTGWSLGALIYWTTPISAQRRPRPATR